MIVLIWTDDGDYEDSNEVLELDCFGVQGDHQPVWFTDASSLMDYRGAVIQDQLSLNSQQITSNYSTRY